MHPWSLDTWSFGLILFEIVTGIPIYMAYKCRLTRRLASSGEIESSPTQVGLLSSQTRQPGRILRLINQNLAGPKALQKTLSQYGSTGLCLGQLNTNAQFVDLLSQMLQIDPLKRKRPSELRRHPFLEGV